MVAKRSLVVVMAMVAALVLTAGVASANVIAYDGFNTDLSGGTGWLDASWAGGSWNSGSIEWSPFPYEGGKVYVPGEDGTTARHLDTGVTSATDFYFSFRFDAEGTWCNPGYVSFRNSSNGKLAQFVVKPIGNPNVGKFYVQLPTNDWKEALLNADGYAKQLVVGHIKLNGAGSDLLEIWSNPTSSTEPETPTASWNTLTLTSPHDVYAYWYGDGGLYFDEIRFAESFAEALTGQGPVPEPAGLGLIGMALLALKRRRK